MEGASVSLRGTIFGVIVVMRIGEGEGRMMMKSDKGLDGRVVQGRGRIESF
jgi:hypothetical protein